MRSVWHPCTQMQLHETVPLVAVQRGSGAWLYDHDGNRYLDAISSWWVNLLGHGHPAVNAAIREQLLVKPLRSSGPSEEILSEVGEVLRAVSGYYNQAARSAATATAVSRAALASSSVSVRSGARKRRASVTDLRPLPTCGPV